MKPDNRLAPDLPVPNYDFLFRKITSIREAEAYVQSMYDHSIDYHFESDATTIFLGPLEEPYILFTAEQAKAANERAEEMFSLPCYDPFVRLCRLYGLDGTDNET